MTEEDHATAHKRQVDLKTKQSLLLAIQAEVRDWRVRNAMPERQPAVNAARTHRTMLDIAMMLKGAGYDTTPYQGEEA